MRKEEGTKKTNKKRKKVTRVRALHKLQEIARPSNTKLFYADVDKQIKKSTVARSQITNRMDRTRGKNNREIIEKK